MGKQQQHLTTELIKFIEQQNIFFVATAMQEGRINLSPKGIDTLRIVNDKSVAWLNLTGSGNETATHLRNDPRMTIMFCAFEGNPRIVRLYGTAKVYHPRDAEWDKLISVFPPIPGSRQIIDLKIELIQTSCGMGVPYMDYKGERGQLPQWAENKGKEGLQEYMKLKNTTSLDGYSTGIFE